MLDVDFLFSHAISLFALFRYSTVVWIGKGEQMKEEMLCTKIAIIDTNVSSCSRQSNNRMYRKGLVFFHTRSGDETEFSNFESDTLGKYCVQVLDECLRMFS